MDRPGKNELGGYQSLLEKVLALHPVQSLPAARKNRYLDGGSSDARMHFFAICFAGLDRTSFRADCLEPRRVPFLESRERSHSNNGSRVLDRFFRPLHGGNHSGGPLPVGGE